MLKTRRTRLLSDYIRKWTPTRMVSKFVFFLGFFENSSDVKALWSSRGNWWLFSFCGLMLKNFSSHNKQSFDYFINFFPLRGLLLITLFDDFFLLLFRKNHLQPRMLSQWSSAEVSIPPSLNKQNHSTAKKKKCSLFGWCGERNKSNFFLLNSSLAPNGLDFLFSRATVYVRFTSQHSVNWIK